MTLRNFLLRLRRRDERGVTLIELTIGMFIFGLTSLLILSIFQTTNQTATSVQSSTTSIADAQIATQQLTKEIRNANLLQITNSGNRLDIQRSDGTCIAWVFYENKLYMKTSTAFVWLSTADWTQRLTNVSKVGTNPVFIQKVAGTAYSLKLGSGNAGSLLLEGQSHTRLMGEGNTSPCFLSS